MTEKMHKRPSRWQACLNGARKWLRHPGVLRLVILAARLIWHLWDRLFGDDPWTFYVVFWRHLSCKTRHFD